MIAAVLLAAGALFQAPADSVHGIVRAASTGEPIPGVQVGLREHAEVTLTDAAGHYVLRNLRGGRGRLGVRFERLGFQPLTVDVMVADGGAASVDVDLAPEAIALPPISILPFDPPAPSLLADSADIGVVRVTQALASRNPLVGEPDALAALAAAPFISGREELAPSLRVRGGSGDENLFLLDGLPWRGPRPPGGTVGMLPTSAVASVDMYTAVPPARYGGALSSTIVLHPQTGGHRMVEGGLDATAVEQAAGTTLPHGATLFVSGRRTYRSVWSQADETGESTNGFGDEFGHVSLPAARGRLDLYYLGSTHQLAFPARVEPSERRADSTLSGPSLQNEFAARASLGGAAWSDSLGEGRSAHARLWYSGVAGQITWGTWNVESTLRDAGVSAEYASRRTEAGLSASRIATSYEAREGTTPRVVLGAAPVVAAAFASQRWTPAARWTLSTGLRLSGTRVWGLQLEPRVWTSVRMGQRALVSLGYARLHQYVQSARNEESVLDALIGADLPIAAGSGGLPPARSDQVTGAIDATLGARTTVQFGIYRRWLSGLALTPLATTRPFADGVIPVGRGSVWGGDATLVHPGDRLDLRLQVGLLSGYRAAGSLRYRPSDARGKFALGMAYQLPERTVVRLALWNGVGRSATPLQDGMQLESSGLRGSGELAGTPEAVLGMPNDTPLPSYARVDLGIAHSWGLSRLGGTRLDASLTVANLFNRRNALALVATPDGRLPVFLLSRTLSLRFRWSFAR